MLEEKILNDYKDAMKARDNLKSSVLSCLRAEFKNAAVDRKKDLLDDNECLNVIKKQVKQHQDSIEQFKNGNRNDLVEKESRELDILQSYLPAQLSEAELLKLIDEVVISTGAVGIKDMGRVMKEAMAKAGPSADNKLLSDLIRQKL